TAASPAYHRFRPSIDNDGLRKLAASHFVIIVIRPGLDITIMAIGAAPLRALAVLKRQILRLRRAPAILRIHCRATPVADKTANERAAQHSSEMAAWAAAKSAPDIRPGGSAHECSCLLAGFASRHEDGEREPGNG